MKQLTRGLVFDLETSPLICYTWDKWPQNGVIEVIEDWQILSIAWQWVGERRVFVKGQDDFPGYKPGVNNDRELVEYIHGLLDNCDYVVAHNGDAFDVKKLNARFLIHDMPPTKPYKQIDTKKLAKRLAGFTSNRLKDLATDLQVNQKGDPGGFGTWKGCLAGDKKAWKKLKEYNKQDIPPLMDLFLKFRPWDQQTFPLNVSENNVDACPHCGSENLQRRGIGVTKTNTYQRYFCNDCRGWSRSRVADYRQAEERMKLVT